MKERTEPTREPSLGAPTSRAAWSSSMRACADWTTVRSEIVPSASGTLSREQALAAVRGLDISRL